LNGHIPITPALNRSKWTWEGIEAGTMVSRAGPDRLQFTVLKSMVWCSQATLDAKTACVPNSWKSIWMSNFRRGYGGRKGFYCLTSASRPRPRWGCRQTRSSRWAEERRMTVLVQLNVAFVSPFPELAEADHSRKEENPAYVSGRSRPISGVSCFDGVQAII